MSENKLNITSQQLVAIANEHDTEEVHAGVWVSMGFWIGQGYDKSQIEALPPGSEALRKMMLPGLAQHIRDRVAEMKSDQDIIDYFDEVTVKEVRNGSDHTLLDEQGIVANALALCEAHNIRIVDFPGPVYYWMDVNGNTGNHRFDSPLEAAIDAIELKGLDAHMVRRPDFEALGLAAELTIDGTDEFGTYTGGPEGNRGPWAVFDIAAQENVIGQLSTREAAVQHLMHELARRGFSVPAVDNADTLSLEKAGWTKSLCIHGTTASGQNVAGEPDMTAPWAVFDLWADKYIDGTVDLQTREDALQGMAVELVRRGVDVPASYQPEEVVAVPVPRGG